MHDMMHVFVYYNDTHYKPHPKSSLTTIFVYVVRMSIIYMCMTLSDDIYLSTISIHNTSLVPRPILSFLMLHANNMGMGPGDEANTLITTSCYESGILSCEH